MTNSQNSKDHTLSDDSQTTTTKHSFKVTFLPNDTTVYVDRGTTIFDAANKAGIYINSICGGDGVCGKCKVILDNGNVETSPTAHLKEDEVQQGYILACSANVVDDVQILIPNESRLEGSKILANGESHKRIVIPLDNEGKPRFKEEPLTKRENIDIDEPTMDDNAPDFERFLMAVQNKTGYTPETLRTDYSVIKEMPNVLRDSGWKVAVTIGAIDMGHEVLEIKKSSDSLDNLGIAIDVGTTTIVAHLIDLNTLEAIDSEAVYNSQMKYGEDYIQRIIYSINNNTLEEMQKTVVKDINGLVTLLTEKSKKNLCDITAVVCTGNTAMIHFLMGLDPCNIRKSPYVPVANNIPPIIAAEVGININKNGLLYVLPSVAAYVGSDITAGVLAIGFDQSEELSLFIDIGTNGEVVLGNNEWMMCCSASAGPAFEGSDVHHGMRAARGAVEKITISKIDERFEVDYKTIDDAKARGICGSGLLDCVANLVRNGIIDRTGKFNKDLDDERVRKTEDGYEFIIVKEKDSDINTDIVITQVDISNLMRSKAAIYAAISTLLKSMEMTVDCISVVYIAGGFGNYLDIKSAITIGMLPDMDHSKIKFVGNTSASGARLALISKEAFDASIAIASSMTYFDLMGNNNFMDEFMSSNFLPHTDVSEFPSVLKELSEQATINKE